MEWTAVVVVDSTWNRSYPLSPSVGILMRYHLALIVSHMASIIDMGYPFRLVGKSIIVQVGQRPVYSNVDESGLAVTKLRVTQLQSGWIILRCLNCRRLSTIPITDPLCSHLGPLSMTSKAGSRAISHCRKEVSLVFIRTA